MWVLQKIRESVESLPLELSPYVVKREDNLSLSAKDSLSNKLHNNVLTPDKVPQFCVPPRIYRRSPLLATKGTTASPHSQGQTQSSPAALAAPHDGKIKSPSSAVAKKEKNKPLPFSAEVYGLAGMYESPNTRRKESLFHARYPGYMLERSLPIATPRVAPKRNLPKTRSRLSGLLPLFHSKSLSETGSTESDTTSSNDSSPPGSPYSSSPPLSFSLDSEEENQPDLQKSHSTLSGLLEGTSSCSTLMSPREEQRRCPLTCFPCDPSSTLDSSLTLIPPLLFPLDILHCQERLQREHVLPLPGCGKVRLSAERTTSSSSFPSSSCSSLFTVRIRVVSVEGLRGEGDLRPLNCALSLCLTPGKLQRQESATIRKCRNPVFNEDFFFTELSQESLLGLQLRLKVVEKPGGGALRRGVVLGVITELLAQLLPL